MKAIRLRTEYLSKPMGMDITKPRFFWNCEEGKTQLAYQILCTCADSVLWDSGKVISSRMTHIPYEGEALRSKMAVTWKVRLWDEADRAGEWSESCFEMGLLEESDWHGQWITGNYRPKKTKRYPVDYFRKTFSAGNGIRSARLYIASCGCYEATLNGSRIGEFYLAPGCTDYRNRIQYQTYDVASLLQEENVLDIQLSDGWYRGALGGWGLTYVYGLETKLRCFLELRYTDGSTHIIESDDTFRWSNDGPLSFADLQDGEVCDARRTPSYAGYARITNAAPGMKLRASNNVIPKEQERFSPKMLTTPAGKTVLDFGQNIAGILRFRIKGNAGQRVFLRFGEMLDENGEFTQKNIQLKRAVGYLNLWKTIRTLVIGDKMQKNYVSTPLQQVEFICSGREDLYRMSACVFGFRYVLVETDAKIKADDFEAAAVYSDMEQVGDFSCSHEGVNQLYRNTLWSMKGNFLDLPTDCPTRERLGWTGDAQLFFETGAYMMDLGAFYRKFMGDLEDCQIKAGNVPAVVPYNGMDVVYNTTGGSVGWSCALVLIPYRYWKWYADDRIIREYYPMMRRYAQFMINRVGAKNKKAYQTNPYAKYVYEKGFHFGEWLEPEEFKTNSMEESQAEVATAYLAYVMDIMVEVAENLGKAADAALFKEYAQGAKNAYDYLFLQTVPDTDRQAQLVRPLALAVAPAEKREAIADRLFRAVENFDYRVATGFLSTPFILPTLTSFGRSDLAYQMLENEKAPGWLYEVQKGATTIWEDWEGQCSLNHYSPGSVCKWLFDTVLGIRVSGENRFTVCPIPGGSLSFAQGSFNSMYGLVKSAWRKTADGWEYMVQIPANTTAVVCIQNQTHEIAAGSHTFHIAM